MKYSGKDQRRVPRLEGLNCAFICTFDDKHTFTEAYLRDIALDSLRFEMLQRLPDEIAADGSRLTAHIPELDLFLACTSHVARTYDSEVGGVPYQGVALRFENLDPAARAQIRALYPLHTEWSEAGF